MASTINLDALIPRADFCESEVSDTTAEKIQTLGLSQLGTESFLVPSLRKPDFQRETNQWTASQIIVFLKSFVDNELVPSVILWKSPSRIFVIDGAHRLSAIMAWIRDDYGDGAASEKFYNGNISAEQKRLAASVRKKIDSEIGNYNKFRQAMMDSTSVKSDPLLAKRASNATTRTLSLQWVEGDAEKAETSFFKINKQGTPLDKIEERLLRDRRKPIAISARSIVRAGSGHKYWSNFDDVKQKEIEDRANEIHGILFTPEIEFPIKTLNLPHGGKSSPIHAYNIIMDLIAYSALGHDKLKNDHFLYMNDDDGSGTIKTLKLLSNVIKRITGNDSPSLGLHPAVFFYSQTGRHWDMMFIAITNVIAKSIRNNDDKFFKDFTKNRRVIEDIFLNNKALIGQANIAIRSSSRIQKWSDFFENLSRGKIFKSGFSPDEMLDSLELKGKLIASEITEASENFSEKTKSAVFLSESVKQSYKCPVCGGLVLAEKSVSYDHVRPKSSGGKGGIDNIQITHPYCNSIKEHLDN